MKKQQFSLGNLLKLSLCGALMVSMVACGGAETNTEVEGVEETTAMGEETEVGDTWDNNRFGTTFASNNRYKEWDANRDNNLDENEFYGSYYDTWDVNNDNSLDQEEWNSGARDFGMEGQNWTEWDTNKDNKLDDNEFRTGISRNNYYSTWDRDGDKMINEREYSDGIFGMWDSDRDNALTNDDYNNRYNRYYGTR